MHVMRRGADRREDCKIQRRSSPDIRSIRCEPDDDALVAVASRTTMPQCQVRATRGHPPALKGEASASHSVVAASESTDLDSWGQATRTDFDAERKRRWAQTTWGAPRTNAVSQEFDRRVQEENGAISGVGRSAGRKSRYRLPAVRTGRVSGSRRRPNCSSRPRTRRHAGTERAPRSAATATSGAARRARNATGTSVATSTPRRVGSGRDARVCIEREVRCLIFDTTGVTTLTVI